MKLPAAWMTWPCAGRCRRSGMAACSYNICWFVNMLRSWHGWNYPSDIRIMLSIRKPWMQQRRGRKPFEVYADRHTQAALNRVIIMVGVAEKSVPTLRLYILSPSCKVNSTPFTIAKSINSSINIMSLKRITTIPLPQLHSWFYVPSSERERITKPKTSRRLNSTRAKHTKYKNILHDMYATFMFTSSNDSPKPRSDWL